MPPTRNNIRHSLLGEDISFGRDYPRVRFTCKGIWVVPLYKLNGNGACTGLQKVLLASQIARHALSSQLSRFRKTFNATCFEVLAPSRAIVTPDDKRIMVQDACRTGKRGHNSPSRLSKRQDIVVSLNTGPQSRLPQKNPCYGDPQMVPLTLGNPQP